MNIRYLSMLSLVAEIITDVLVLCVSILKIIFYDDCKNKHSLRNFDKKSNGLCISLLLTAKKSVLC
jgi:hypothetical protein